jgi:hypothetical protein
VSFLQVPGEHLHANATYWFERELQYAAAELDLDALHHRAERIVLLAGEDSRATPPTRSTSSWPAGSEATSRRSRAAMSPLAPTPSSSAAPCIMP